MKIKKLPEELISKIAAGEVIERPAFVVKELIENSIDAESKNIIVAIKDFGLKEITVIDDGAGINKNELSLAIKPHTTSKIFNTRDLSKIKSMGFRGEALSSIVSISNFEISSKQNGKTGYGVNNKSKKPIAVAMPTGTKVIIKNIFIHTPARKKFLSSKQTEYRHIIGQFQSFALAYPEISFELLHNKKSVFKVKKENLENRIKNILGEELFSQSFEVNFSDSYIKIDGFISHPQISFKTKSKMYIFINGRRVHNTSLTSSVKEGYKHLLPHYAYPFCYLSIKLPEDLVDVNVHPRKEVVKFVNQKDIDNTIKEATTETLNNNNLTFSNVSFAKKLTTTELASNLRKEIMQTSEGQIGKVKKRADIIQLLNLYIITETESGILILDQHAVHEAILYFKYKEAYKARKSKNYKSKLKKPVIVKITEAENSLISENINHLISIGFDLQEFGNNTYKLSSIPLVTTDLDPKNNLLQTLQELEKNENVDIDDHINDMLEFLSCRSAIKSGQKLTKKQMKELVLYLDKIDLGYTCPHGRPVKIELSKNYLDKMFKRI